MRDKKTLSYLDGLMVSLKKKEMILEELGRLTKEQELLLKEDEFQTDVFSKVMEEKGVRIESINRMDEAFASVFEKIQEEIRTHSPLYRQEIEEMQESIKKLTEKGIEIEALERRNQLKLEYVLMRNRTKIRNFNLNNGAMTRYYNNMANSVEDKTYFLDQKK